MGRRNHLMGRESTTNGDQYVEEDESAPILGTPHVSIKVYSRRWYVLLVFALANFNQALIYNTWGPITESSEAVFHWDDSNIGMLVNSANIAFMLCVLPACSYMDGMGLRGATLLATFIFTMGVGVRCISLEPTVATWLCNLCSVLVALGAIVPYAGPARISSLWFPPGQRATATAWVANANYLGIAAAFIIGPEIVRSPKTDNHFNNTNSSDYFYGGHYVSAKNVTNIPEMKSDIQHLFYLHLGLCALGFLLVLLYFPSKPQQPPSVSASLERTEYLKGLKKLLSNYSVWMAVLAYAIPVGVLGAWSSVLAVNLKPLHVGQKTAGYLGFWMTLAGCIAGQLISKFSDVFMRRIKMFLIMLYIGAAAASAWFTMLCENYIPFHLPSLYVSSILIGAFVNGSIPLFFEITCEASYPVGEGVTGGLVTLGDTVTGIVFLLILLIKSIGTSWMNWVLLGSILFAIPILCLFPERYKRTDLDITIIVPHSNVQKSNGD